MGTKRATKSNLNLQSEPLSVVVGGDVPVAGRISTMLLGPKKENTFHGNKVFFFVH